MYQGRGAKTSTGYDTTLLKNTHLKHTKTAVAHATAVLVLEKLREDENILNGGLHRPGDVDGQL